MTTPRLVSLRGSDFTGLGVEVYGGLKEGIFVRKVMPQGPAAGLVNTGKRESTRPQRARNHRTLDSVAEGQDYNPINGVAIIRIQRLDDGVDYVL